MFILFIQKILYIFNVFAAELYKNGGRKGGLCPQMVRVPDQPHLHLRPAAEDGGLRGRDAERGGPQHQVPQGELSLKLETKVQPKVKKQLLLLSHLRHY